MKKKDVIELLEAMPDEIDPRDLIYKLYLKQKVEAADAAVAAGDLLDHDEVVRITNSWPE